MTVRINWGLRAVSERAVRRIFRNELGDWCAEVETSDGLRVAMPDYHPTIAMMHALRDEGANITEEVIAQGAEGTPIRWNARPAEA